MNPLSVDDGSMAWTVLADHLEQFLAAWECGAGPPRLQVFLPESPGELRRMTLIELIKIDLEYRWQAGRGECIEFYLREFPELPVAELPADVLLEEWRARRQAGEAPTLEDYQVRFPLQAEELPQLMAVADVGRSTIGGMVRKPPSIEPGTTLADFELVALLGEGAFARVFLARQKTIVRMVALKVSTDRSQEPQTLAQLDHPGIVRVHDQRLLESEGVRLLYMEYVPGGNLQEVLALAKSHPIESLTGQALLDSIDMRLRGRGIAIPIDSEVRQRIAQLSWPAVVCWLGVRLALALDYAHARGVLHRDIKPANVLLSAEGHPRLADFNVSYSQHVEGSSAAAYFGGSLAYMSPEQLAASHPAKGSSPSALDGRSDLYSLAVMLWELLVTVRPFASERVGKTWRETIEVMLATRIAGVPRERLAELPPGTPKGMGELLLCCLEADPAERPATAADLARRLALCLHPQARRWMNPPPWTWMGWSVRHPLAAILLATFIPNVVAAILNYLYQRQTISMPHPSAEVMLGQVVIAIHTVALPLAIGIAAKIAWPVVQMVQAVRGGQRFTTATLQPMRILALRLGGYLAWLSVVVWTVAGIVDMISLRATIDSLSSYAAVHVFASLVLCGLMAAVYPYLLVTLVVTRSLFPVLVRNHSINAVDCRELEHLSRTSWSYLLLAFSVPLVSAALQVVVHSNARSFVAILCGVGLIGSGLAFALTLAIQTSTRAWLLAARTLDGSVDAIELRGGRKG